MSFELSNVEPLLNNLVRLREHIRRNRQTDLFRRIQINYQLELRRLLDRDIRGFGAFEDLVYVSSSAVIQVTEIRSVRHQTPASSIFPRCVNRRESIFGCKVENLLSVSVEHPISTNEKGALLAIFHRRKN